MTYIVFFRTSDGYLSQWATIASSPAEAREKFLKRRGTAEQILYIRKLVVK